MAPAYEYFVQVRVPGDWQLIEDCVGWNTAIESARAAAAEGDEVEVWCKETDTLVWAAAPQRPPVERINRKTQSAPVGGSLARAFG